MPRCRCMCRCMCRKAKRLPSPADPAGGTSLEPEDNSSQVQLTSDPLLCLQNTREV